MDNKKPDNAPPIGGVSKALPVAKAALNSTPKEWRNDAT